MYTIRVFCAFHIYIVCQYNDLSSVGVKTLQKAGATEIAVDSLGNAEGTNMYIRECFVQ